MYTIEAASRAVSVREARAAISALLDDAEAGRSTLIIRSSRPSALLVPVPAARSAATFDPDEVRWYRPRGGTQKIGFTGEANAAFLHRPRDERARILETLARIAVRAPIVVATL